MKQSTTLRCFSCPYMYNDYLQCRKVYTRPGFNSTEGASYSFKMPVVESVQGSQPIFGWSEYIKEDNG